jgi:hypothetical protein
VIHAWRLRRLDREIERELLAFAAAAAAASPAPAQGGAQ